MSKPDSEASGDEALALPPLYVLRTVERCPHCAQPTHVFALGCAGFQDAEDDTLLEEFHFLHHIGWLPESIAAMLESRCRGFRFGEVDGETYLMNHCACGATLDDELLHGDAGAAFWPATPAGFSRIRVFRLSVAEPVPIMCSYTLGGGEHLGTRLAESW